MHLSGQTCFHIRPWLRARLISLNASQTICYFLLEKFWLPALTTSTSFTRYYWYRLPYWVYNQHYTTLPSKRLNRDFVRCLSSSAAFRFHLHARHRNQNKSHTRLALAFSNRRFAFDFWEGCRTGFEHATRCSDCANDNFQIFNKFVGARSY